MDYLNALKSHTQVTEKKLRYLGEPTAKTAKTPDQGSSGSSGSTPPLVSETFFSGAPPADDHADRAHPEPPTAPPMPPPAPEADAATTRPTATTTAPPRLPLIAEVRTEPGKPWFTCIAGKNPVTGEWPTLETLRAEHRTKWGEQCETRLKEASQ